MTTRIYGVQGAIASLSELSSLILNAETDLNARKALAKRFDNPKRTLQVIDGDKVSSVSIGGTSKNDYLKDQDKLLRHANSVFLLAVLRHCDELNLDGTIESFEKRKKAISEDLSTEQILDWSTIYKAIKKAVEYKLSVSKGDFSFDDDFFTGLVTKCSEFSLWLHKLAEEIQSKKERDPLLKQQVKMILPKDKVAV